MAANCVCATRAAAATELLLYGGSRNRFYFTGANVQCYVFTLLKIMDVGILLPSFLFILPLSSRTYMEKADVLDL